MKIALEKFKSALVRNNDNFFRYYIILSNNLIRLKPLEIEHKSVCTKFSANNAIWQYFAINIGNEQNMNNYIDDSIEQRKLGLRYHFVIEDQKTNEIVGSTAFGNYSPKDGR